MPLYVYRCDCGEVTEEFRSIADRDNTPACKCGQSTHREITATQLAPIWGTGDGQGSHTKRTQQFIKS